MPPRVAKRGAASAGQKRTPRASRGNSKAQTQLPQAPAEDSVKVEDVSTPVVEEVKIVEKSVVLDLEREAKSDANGLGPIKSKFILGHRIGYGNLCYNHYAFLSRVYGVLAVIVHRFFVSLWGYGNKQKKIATDSILVYLVFA